MLKTTAAARVIASFRKCSHCNWFRVAARIITSVNILKVFPFLLNNIIKFTPKDS